MSKDQLLAEPDVATGKGIVLAEEAALKRLLSGITVPSPQGRPDRTVPVWFRWPESTTSQTFPHILVDLLGPPQPDYERWTSVYDVGMTPSVFENQETGALRIGQYSPSMDPDSMGTATSLVDPSQPGGLTIVGHQIRPLAFKLYFQVAVYSRSISDDRFLMARFSTDIFPPRPFFLGVDADATWRRCELLDAVSDNQIESTEDRKVRFRQVYTVSIEAEIPVDTVHELVKAERLHIDVYDIFNIAREPQDHAYNAPHLVALDNITVTPEGP